MNCIEVQPFVQATQQVFEEMLERRVTVGSMDKSRHLAMGYDVSAIAGILWGTAEDDPNCLTTVRRASAEPSRIPLPMSRWNSA